MLGGAEDVRAYYESGGPYPGTAWDLPIKAKVTGDDLELDVVIELDVDNLRERYDDGTGFGGQLVVTRQEFRKRPGGPQVTAKRQRDFPLGFVVDAVVRFAAKPAGGGLPVPRPLMDWGFDRVRRTQPLVSERPPRKRGVSLEDVAKAAEGVPANRLIRTLRTKLNVSEGQAKRLLREGREAGVVPHTDRSLKASIARSSRVPARPDSSEDEAAGF